MASRLGAPHRAVTILEGESLVNDASGLVAYRFAVHAAVVGTFSLPSAAAALVLLSLAGVAVGLTVGWVTIQLLRLVDDPPVEITLSLVSAYAAYFAAERVGASGVLSCVAAGFFESWQSARVIRASTRLRAVAVWNTFTFLLNGLVFLLVGFHLRPIWAEVSETPWPTLAAHTFWICLTVIATRLLWIFPGTYLPRLFSQALRARDPSPPWRTTLVVGWAGMRGAVSLALALAVPRWGADGRPFPGRGVIVFVTFAVIFVTLVVQGLTLPLVIRRLGVEPEGAQGKNEELEARLAIAHAGRACIDAMLDEPGVPRRRAEHLRSHYEERIERLTQRLGDAEHEPRDLGKEMEGYRSVAARAIEAEREELIRRRKAGELRDRIFRQIERELDLEEERL